MLRGVVVFGRDARAVVTPSAFVSRLDSPRADGAAADATDLERALRLAAALFPPGRARKIVILSDGVETAGDALALAPSLRANHIFVDVAAILPPDKSLPPEALLRPLSLAPSVASRAPFTLPVHVWSSEAQTAALTLRRDGTMVERRAARLPAGDSIWNFTQTIAGAGIAAL